MSSVTETTAILGIGANIAGEWGSPRETLTRLGRELETFGIAIEAAAPLIETPPFGPVPQPNYLNGALRVRTALPPLGLLAVLKALERKAGRRKTERWGPRPLDIDIVAFGDRVVKAMSADGPLEIPHPGLPERDFVLGPLMAVAPDWRHPVSGLTAAEMLNALSA